MNAPTPTPDHPEPGSPDTTIIQANPRFTFLPQENYFTAPSSHADMALLLTELGFDLRPGGIIGMTTTEKLRGCLIPEGWTYSPKPADGLRTAPGVLIATNVFEPCPPSEKTGSEQESAGTATSSMPKALIWNSLETTLALIGRREGAETPAG